MPGFISDMSNCPASGLCGLISERQSLTYPWPLVGPGLQLTGRQKSRFRFYHRRVQRPDQRFQIDQETVAEWHCFQSSHFLSQTFCQLTTSECSCTPNLPVLMYGCALMDREREHSCVSFLGSIMIT